MKIYYSKKETKGDITIEIKAEDDVHFEYESQHEAFKRLEGFVCHELDHCFFNEGEQS